MSATIHIGSGVKIIPQPDFQASRMGDNGAWTATQSFQIVKGSLDDPTVRAEFNANKSLADLDPNSDNIWSFLRVRSVSPMTIPGGWQMVQVTFGGLPNVDSQGNPIDPSGFEEFQVTYAMRGQTADVPISEHPKFKALSQQEQNTLGKIMSGEFGWGIPNDPFADPESDFLVYWRTNVVDGEGQPVWPGVPEEQQLVSDDAKEFADRIAAGRTTYRAGGFTWSKRWAAPSPLTSAQLNRLGKVATPPGGPPTPGTGRNWLLIYANFEQTGEIDANPSFTNEIVFELSDEGGWDTFLYQ